MKKLRFLFATIFLVSLAVSCEYTVENETVVTEDGSMGTPLLVQYPTNSGWNTEWSNWGCGDFMFKINDWNSSIGLDSEGNPIKIQVSDEEGNPLAGVFITITNNDGKKFDWSIEGAEVCAILVKGGNNAVRYAYTDGTYDVKLVAPVNTKTKMLGDTYSISHVTFFFSLTDNHCYQRETAWVAVSQGQLPYPGANWATYIPYNGTETSYPIFAGQHYNAGTATLSAPDATTGLVTVSIELNAGWIFYYGSEVEQTLKIQPYATEPTKAPGGVGKFTYKQIVEVGEDEATQNVSNAPFYGIHLDVAKLISCQ